MYPLTLNPKDIKIIQGVPPVMGKDDRVSLDSEWIGMDGKRLHRPTGEFACATFCPDGKTVYVVTDKKDLPKAFKNIEKAVWIFANAKFDVFHLRRLLPIPQRKRLWDVILLEQVMFSGYYDSFSLADLTRRYLGLYLEKETREEFSDPNAKMTKEMIEYAAIDPVVTWRVYQEQKKIICDTDLDIWTEIELPFMWTLLAMSGVKLDKDAWLKLAQDNQKEAENISKKYTINLNSPAQVKKYFKEELGISVDSTGEEILQEKAEMGCQFAKDMLIYRTFSKRSSTYGAKFIDDYVEPDGFIYGDIYQMGAVTGRTSSRHPNLQNQPHDTRYRSCFISDKGKVTVVGDWGAQEPRFAAHFSEDEKLIEALNGTEKLYIAVARAVLGIDVKKGSKEYDNMKSTILGIFYGMSGMGLSKRIGTSEEEATRLINKFLKTFPGVQKYITKQQSAKDYVESISGRKIWLNKYSSQWKRVVLNYPIQSSAAEAMKIATHKFLVDWMGEDFYTGSPLQLIVHDELVLSVPKKDEKKAKKALEKCMVEVAESLHIGIKGVAEVFSGPNWGCKQ